MKRTLPQTVFQALEDAMRAPKSGYPRRKGSSYERLQYLTDRVVRAIQPFVKEEAMNTSYSVVVLPPEGLEGFASAAEAIAAVEGVGGRVLANSFQRMEDKTSCNRTFFGR